MKKNIRKTFIAILCMFTVFCIHSAGHPMSVVNAHPVRVVDEADLLTNEEEFELLTYVNEISEREQFDVVIATVNSMNGNNIQDYAADFYDYGGYGMGNNYDGVLFLISMEEREWFILTTGYGIDLLNDYEIDRIGDEVVSYLSDGDYAQAFYLFAQNCEEEILKAGMPEEENMEEDIWEEDWQEDVIYVNEEDEESTKPSIFISIGAGLFLGMIAALVMRGELKSVRKQTSAGAYEKRETRKITKQSDTYLYHTVTRVRRETESSNHTRSSHGSTTFRGSSGRSHGGRGGGF